MAIVGRWTGADAEALRTAYRMTGEAFAETLGVAVRSVREWKKDPGKVPEMVNQEALDTLLARAPADVRQRFLAATNRDSPGPANGSADHAITVSIAIVRRDDHVLLVRRRDSAAAGLSWQFPAGMVKPGTDKATTAVHETYAETGVHCAVLDHIGGRLHPDTGVYCDYFVCEYLTGEVDNGDPIENASVEWVARDAVTRFIPADRIYAPILERLKEE